MPTIDNITKSAQPRNVGLGALSFDPKLIAGAILTPRGYTITATQLATLQTVLTNAALNDSKLLRIYPISNLVENADNSEKAVTQSFGYGAEFTVRDGIYKWAFQFVKGGKSLSDALRTFNGSNFDFFFVDQKNVLIGTSYTDSTGAKGLKAIPSIEIYTQPYGSNDGKKLAEYKIEFKCNPKYLNEEGSFISDADFDILDTVLGIQDVVLSNGTATATSGTYTLSAKTSLGTNMGDLYGSSTGLAQASCWKAYNATTKAVITLASSTPIAYDSQTGLFTIKLDTTDPDYPTTGKVAIDLVGPTELATAGVSGFESTGAIEITKN